MKRVLPDTSSIEKDSEDAKEGFKAAWAKLLPGVFTPRETTPIPNHADIPGLTYCPSLITKEEEKTLVAWIQAQPWSSALARRTQHYGYQYDYRTRAVPKQLGPLPDAFQLLLERLRPYATKPFNQIIVNEYKPGQGIGTHIDRVGVFGDDVVSVSLLAACPMTFAPTRDKTRAKQAVHLEPRSAVVLQKDARYRWTHEIAAARTYTHEGAQRTRELRISVTLRTVVIVQ